MALAGAGSLGALDELAAFERLVEALPRTHPRRVGLVLLRLGVAAFLPACITGPAGPNICYGIAGLGFALCAPPLRSLVGLGWGLLFAGWLALTALIAGALGPERFPMHGTGLSYTWVALLLAQVGFRHRPTLIASLWATLALVCASAGLAVLQFLVGIGDGPLHLRNPGKPHEHGVGFYGLHLTEGPVMAASSLLLACALCTGLLPKAWARLGILAAWTGLACSTARMAYLGAVAGWWLWRGLGSLTRLAVAGAQVAVAAGLALGLLLVVQHERTSTALAGHDGRFVIWRASARLIAEHPIVGTGGPEGYKEAYNAAFREANPGVRNEFEASGGSPHAHNSLISIAAEHGLIAVPLYLALLGSILAALWRQRLACDAAWRLGASVTVTMLLAGMFEHLAGHVVPANLLFAVLGLALALPTALASRAVASTDGMQVAADARMRQPTA